MEKILATLCMASVGGFAAWLGSFPELPAFSGWLGYVLVGGCLYTVLDATTERFWRTRQSLRLLGRPSLSLRR